MSSLSKQNKAFAASMAAASSRFAKKTTVTPAISTPPSSQSIGASEPRASVATAKQQIYSQPAETGTGRDIQTQIVFAIEYLRKKPGVACPISPIIRHVLPRHADDSYKTAVATILSRHPQVTFIPKTEGSEALYKFRPKHDIYSAEDLLRQLQSLQTFNGINAKELLEGWPDAYAGINKLEEEHKVMLTRHKKDGTPHHVYADDASLYITVDNEFRGMWNKIRVPDDHQTVLDELVKEGQTPAGKVGKKKVAVMSKIEKTKKKPRRGGKLTNKHMQGVFKDFSHMRK